MSFIDEMRQRPEEERIAFAMIAAGVVAIILFLVWGLTFFRADKNIAHVETSGQRASAAESFKEAREGLSQTAQDIAVQYDELKQVIDTARIQAEAQPQGTNTVDVSIDDDGNVRVDTIVVPKEELDFQE